MIKTPRRYAFFVALFGTFALTGHAADDWQRCRDEIRTDRALVRYYTFEGPLAASATVANLAGTGGELGYQVVPKRGAPAEKFQVVEGHRPGRKAVRLDQNILAAEGFPSPGKAFSVEGWLRVGGVGTHRGNEGSTGGTLLSLGSGYWDGFRLTYSYPNRTIGLEIGRPKPSHSVGIRTEPVAEGVWHHLAATWDGRQMRVYVDGLLAAWGELDGVWTTPARGVFRVGFANSGVGSVVLDVDEVAIYRRALGADEVLRHACTAPAVQEPVAVRLRKAADCLAVKDAAGAGVELGAVLRSPGLAGELLSTLRFARATCLAAEHKVAEAAGELADVLAGADCVPQNKAAALAMLRGLVRESPGNALAKGTHGPLLAMPDLRPEERWAIRLSLAHSRFAERDYPGARAEYARIVAQSDAPAVYRSIAQLRIGENYARGREYGQAIREYGRLSELPDAPGHHRWEAEQAIAQLRRLEKGMPPRDPAVGRMHLPSRPVPAVTYYVAPDGFDTNPGTREKPFATLERARDEIRRVKRSGGLKAGGAAVCVRGGRYRVTKTFELSAEDSGSQGAPIVYQAARGETPIASGGVRLSGFQPVGDPKILARLPAESRDKVRQVELKRGKGDSPHLCEAPCGPFRQMGAVPFVPFKPLVLGGYASGHGFRTVPVMELYFNGAPLPMARWPNEGWAEVADVAAVDHEIHGIKGSNVGRLKYEGDRPSRWLQEKEGFLYGYWFWSWADSYERIDFIDPRRREISLAPPWARYGFRKGQRYFGINLLAEIDAPGEWFLDRQSGILYFWPPTGPEKAALELSVMESPFVKLEKVSHVTLEGLTWEMGAGDAVVLRGCHDCLLAGCTVRCFAGDGVKIEGGSRCGLLSCDVFHMGRGGTAISGGDRRTLKPSGHFVENCHIHHLSRLHHTYTPAVRMTGVGSRIAHNLFHHIASSAINLGGNEHVVEFNEAHHVVQESDDQGGVDMFGNPTYRGNIYRYNFWHHVGDWQGKSPWPPGGQAGIRLDDAISGVLVYGNVFYRCSAGTWGFGGLQIHGGKDNVVDNNLFVDCRVAVSFSPWGEKHWREHVEKPEHTRDIDRALYLARYPRLARLAEDHDANLLARNVVYRCRDFTARERGTNQLVDNCLVAGEGGSAEETDLSRLLPDARALDRCACVPIPVAEIGLYRDRYRSGLPNAR